ncbi:MAG: hypothetical protein HYS73_01500 [Parcubacteria group bacterium]|nr:hypothetical protein [Parcubacteria group bacterium]
MPRKASKTFAFGAVLFALFFFSPPLSYAENTEGVLRPLVPFFSYGSYQPFSFKEDNTYYFLDAGENVFIGASFARLPLIVSIGLDLDSFVFYGTNITVRGQSIAVELGFGEPYFNAYLKFSEGVAAVGTELPEGKLVTRHEPLRKQRYGIESGLGVANLFVESGVVVVGGHQLKDATLVGIKIRVQF